MQNKTVKLWFCDLGLPETEQSIIEYHHDFYQLLSQHFNIALTPHAPDFLIYEGWGYDFRSYSCPRIFYTGECLVPNFAECDYAFSHEPTTDKNQYFPYFSCSHAHSMPSLCAPRDVDALVNAKSKFCNFIYANPKCETRNNFFHALSDYKKVDAAGPLFNNTTGLLGRKEKEWLAAKPAFMRSYKFSISFENESWRGYVTEKIVDAFLAGSVPIYWGSPDIAQHFNPNAFINCHDYNSMEAVINKVMELDNDDDLYRQYLAAPPFVDNKPFDYAPIITRFAEIFSKPDITPVAHSWYNRALRAAPRIIAKRHIKHKRKHLKQLAR